MNAANVLLQCGRLVARTVLAGVSSQSAAADEGFCAAHQHRRTHGRGALRCNHRQLGSSAQADAEKQRPACSRAARLLPVWCGFPKDLLFGPSSVGDPYSFGDDACFVASHRSADVVGVADGVGGWREYGVDPSRFSRTLMQTCAQLVESGQFKPHLPAELLAAAFRLMYQARLAEAAGEDAVVGSSTACVVVLDRAACRLHAANLGDSGFVVVRAGRVVARSEEQQHYFNAPFQLSLPPQIDPEEGFFSDSAEAAHTATLDVQVGDVVVLATDGLFDNLPEAMIEAELSRLAESSCVTEAQLQASCNSLALQARRLAFDDNFLSPFARKARSAGYEASGGKPDDITVLLVLVVAAQSEPV